MSLASPSRAHAAVDDPLDALDQVIRAERDGLARAARREGLGPEDAFDCVQDAFSTFLGLAIRGEVPEGAPAVRAFLRTVVKNAAKNRRRLHRLARPHESIDALEPSLDLPSTEALVAEAEEHVRLRACVDRLCETQRAVVTLRLLEERAGEDVAESLGITRGHVDVLLHRAKANLRVCMLDEKPQ